MRFLRRIWFAVQEVAFLFVGLLASLLVAGLGYAVMPGQGVALLVFVACVALALTMLFRLRYRHKAWKIKYDAEKYERERAWRRAFPERSRWTRSALRIGIWLPSLLAAFVLFFLPPASHIVQLGGVHLGPYKVPVPWNILILSGPSSPLFDMVMTFTANDNNPFGLTHSFRGNRFSASMEFVVYYAPDIASGYSNPGDPTREFKLGLSVLRCWEGDGPAGFRRISCRTAGPDHSPELNAWFLGRAASVPLFYQILSGIETTLP